MKFTVTFYSCNAEVEAKDENEAEVKARELLYEGELDVEVESVEKVEDIITPTYSLAEGGR